ncbi:hypothetical protein B0H13DRAFT_1869894 [Mycena leptocephala]|nr:hypothetical protein B0H13DRAFT_1869894 [Mycena leptocephala]
MEPPPYDSLADVPLLSSNDGPSSEPPAYDGRLTPVPIAIQLSELREFTSEIPTGDGTPWAILTIQGDRRLSKTMPTVLEGSNLVGSVKFLLQSSESIHAVCILIRGELLKGKDGAATIPFFESKHTLGLLREPRRQNVPPSPVSSDRLTIFHIQYVAELRVVRGKLRPDDKVARTFGYFSMQRPGPPSALRQLAYQENSPLLGPTADHEGWTSQSASVKGDLFSSRQIELKFTVGLDIRGPASLSTTYCPALARNPTFVHTTHMIPCALTIDTEDTHAFDLLRRLQHAWYISNGPPGGTTRNWNPDYSARRLMGEIHLRADLQPSFAIFGFRVEYAVVVFPFQAAGFKPLDSGPVLRQGVEIVTRYAPGPRQKMYTAPSEETRNAAIDAIISPFLSDPRPRILYNRAPPPN